VKREDIVSFVFVLVTWHYNRERIMLKAILDVKMKSLNRALFYGTQEKTITFWGHYEACDTKTKVVNI